MMKASLEVGLDTFTTRLEFVCLDTGQLESPVVHTQQSHTRLYPSTTSRTSPRMASHVCAPGASSQREHVNPENYKAVLKIVT